ncbi:ureidoglycolate dehydrogenase [Bacillus sp. DX1.1]|uniref:ureidoglycolate dehydrogenase n=1 Tax=unclassified Bacillus (in: firmicutes) TaxID=185979 RepID=UPI002570A3C0|nr:MULTISPECIES: ureidoglycolate dehydrogenase [unclassified Bacillus (in: firmicutes)]MDM5154552.1 ureidoglycolate dehydrogenase [Bacillus sp. DX1.1]WJE83447.1 ureidoglycolate dehydrogenase [Bacillus sp. DX3.1]
MRVMKKELHNLIQNKIEKAGLTKEHAEIVADVLTFADARGIHSHGAVRVEYYSERIAKNGIAHHPNFHFEKTGPASAIFEADNGSGHVAAKLAMEEAIHIAKENGVAIVGIKHMSHSGALAYFVEMAAKQDMVALSVCQSDPMVVPFGGAEEYFGTNPIAFAAPTADERMLTFDMATTVQAWGKILHARSKGESIPPTWAVDEQGAPTTDPSKVNALLPIAGPKGYGLMMMVDVLSGILLGLPFGKHVSSMYADLSKGRDLGQLHIVINPAFFTDMDLFKQHMSTMLDEVKQVKPAPGHEQVYFPGERGRLREKAYEENGIEIVDDIYEYLISEDIHYNRYDHKNKFAE